MTIGLNFVRFAPIIGPASSALFCSVSITVALLFEPPLRCASPRSHLLQDLPYRVITRLRRNQEKNGRSFLLRALPKGNHNVQLQVLLGHKRVAPFDRSTEVLGCARQPGFFPGGANGYLETIGLLVLLLTHRIVEPLHVFLRRKWLIKRLPKVCRSTCAPTCTRWLAGS